jgi:hypothetical protein
LLNIEAVAAEVDVKQRWLGEQGRCESFLFENVPETRILQLEAQPPARTHTRTDKSRSSGGHDVMRQGDDILAKGAVRVEHSAPRQHVGMVGDILAVVAFDHGD